MPQCAQGLFEKIWINLGIFLTTFRKDCISHCPTPPHPLIARESYLVEQIFADVIETAGDMALRA